MLVPPSAGATDPSPFRECSSSLTARTVKRKVAPAPGLSVNQIRPPIDSATFLQMDRPMPAPGIDDPWRRSNGRKILLDALPVYLGHCLGLR